MSLQILHRFKLATAEYQGMVDAIKELTKTLQGRLPPPEKKLTKTGRQLKFYAINCMAQFWFLSYFRSVSISLPIFSSMALLLPASQQSTSRGPFGWLLWARLSQLLGQSYCTSLKAHISVVSSKPSAVRKPKVKEPKVELSGQIGAVLGRKKQIEEIVWGPRRPTYL
jgi:hypothetical protein